MKLSSNNKYIPEINKILEWEKEFPDVLYENLKVLDDYLDVINCSKQKKIGNPVLYECYSCYKSHGYDTYYCDNYCNQNNRFYGVDCSDENNNYKNKGNNIDEKVRILIEMDRTKYNSEGKGKKSTYWLHLKPYRFHCDDFLWFLSLRIYFKWLELSKKIEIGWIGRHLYLPCPKKDNINDCQRKVCPLHPNSPIRNLNVDELANYLKQWP